MPRPFPELAALAAALLAGCGQTGPLYLPDTGIETPVEIRGPAPAPEPPPAPQEPERKEASPPER
jgi:predicted small lipoprotein YifL